MPFSTIIFDCDGVLVDSERIYVSVEREHLAEIGLHYELNDYMSRFVGLMDVDFIAALTEDYRALDKGSFPHDFEQTMRAACLTRIENELLAIDGIDGFLDHYSGDVAVASSSTISGLHKKLRLTDLHHRFDPHIYSGEHVERGKPAPDLFLHAAESLGSRPEECLVVEDSVNGVKAGRAAGMTVWGFTGGGHADDGLTDRLNDAGAHDVYDSFESMRARF
ncbi:MAG: HAD family hydrolase [Stappiaceae bacterium]